METVISKNVEKIDEINKRVVVEVSKEFFDELYNKTLRNFTKKAKISGFRQGKAPAQLVEKKYKHDIKEETYNSLIFETVFDVIEEEGLPAVQPPQIETIEELKDRIKYSAIVEVKPDIKVRGYAGIKLTRKKREITDEDVNKQINRLKQIYTKYEKVDKAISEGNVIEVSFTGYLGDKEFDRADKIVVEPGKKEFLPEFENALLGMKKNEEKEVKITLPENHHKKEVAGKTVLYKIKVLEIYRKELPEENENFAKMVGNYSSMEELREKTKEQLKNNAEREEKRELMKQVLEKLLSLHPDFKAPPSVVKKRFMSYVEELTSGYHLKNLDEKSLKLIYEKAEKDVKGDIILEKIAEKEGFSPTEEEVYDEARKLNPSLRNLNNEELDRILWEEDLFITIEDSIKIKRAMDFVLGKANIKDEK